MAAISSTKRAKSSTHWFCKAIIASSATSYSSWSLSSNPWSMWMRSSAGSPAWIWRAMVSKMVFPYLDFSILSKVAYSSVERAKTLSNKREAIKMVFICREFIKT